MPKLTKLCLHLLRLCRKNRGLFFPDTVYITQIVNGVEVAVGNCFPEVCGSWRCSPESVLPDALAIRTIKMIAKSTVYPKMRGNNFQ